MDISGVVYSLQKNRFLCAQLDYPKIVAALIQGEVMTPQQSAQIQQEFMNNEGQMEELISALIKLNSRKVFLGFHEALLNSGELTLAKKLLADSDCIVPTENASFLPDIPTEIWNKILGFLPTNDMLNARLVSTQWESIITDSYASRFTMRFDRKSGEQRMIHFVSRGHNFSFRRKLSKFVFQVDDGCRLGEEGKFVSRAFYKAFFVEYGVNINWMELSGPCEDLVVFIFSPEIQPYLRNVKTLRWANTCMDEIMKRLPHETFSLLSGLEYLFLKCVSGVNGTTDDYYIRFLEKLLKNEHQLKGLVFEPNEHYDCWIEESQDLSPGLMDLNLETLELLRFVSDQRVNRAGLESLTAVGASGKLKEVWFQPDSDVEAEDIYNFLSSHQHTLARIQFTPQWERIHENMVAFPPLDSLRHLCIVVQYYGVTVPLLSFCAQAPNLKLLEFKELRFDRTTVVDIDSYKPPFQHMELETLKLTFAFFCGTSLRPKAESFLEQVLLCFPKLNKIEMDLAGRERDMEWPPLIGRLVRQPVQPSHIFTRRDYGL